MLPPSPSIPFTSPHPSQLKKKGQGEKKNNISALQVLLIILIKIWLTQWAPAAAEESGGN